MGVSKADFLLIRLAWYYYFLAVRKGGMPSGGVLIKESLI